MVGLLLYPDARGNRSSRAVERACVEDVVYRVVAAKWSLITRRGRVSEVL
jgi:hypothetical protein